MRKETHHGIEVEVTEEVIDSETITHKTYMQKTTCPICNEEVSEKRSTNPQMMYFGYHDTIEYHIRSCKKRKIQRELVIESGYYEPESAVCASCPSFEDQSYDETLDGHRCCEFFKSMPSHGINTKNVFLAVEAHGSCPQHPNRNKKEVNEENEEHTF